MRPRNSSRPKWAWWYEEKQKAIGNMLWQLPFSFNKKEPILKTSLIFLNFIDPGLFEFIAKEMFTRFAVIYRQRDVYLQNRLDHSFFKLSWYSNLFAYFTTWKEKQWTPAHATQGHIHIGKKEQTFLPKETCLSVFVLTLSPFPSLLLLYSSQTGYYFTSNWNEVQICIMKYCTSFQIYPAFHRPALAKFKPPQQNSPSCLCSAASFLSSNAWFAISSLARFEVITKIASLHTIVFPCPSVKRPWIKNRGFFFHQNLKRSKTTKWKIFKPSMTQIEEKKQSSLKFKYRCYLVKQLEHDC